MQSSWTVGRALALLEQHGAMLQSGRGPLPSLAEAIAGEPIRGSWWGHAKGKLIFQVLNEVYESGEVAACKLVSAKLTLIHRRLWPALAAVARDRRVPGLDRVRQQHMPSGEHRNFVERWPGWLPARLPRITADEARDRLGPLLPFLTSSSAAGTSKRRAGRAPARRRASAARSR